jgi:acid phosphatase
VYTRVRNPFVYYTDNASRCHDVPYPGSGGLISALDGSTPPDFVWISPNLDNDMHYGSVQQGDAWLKANLAPVLTSSWFSGGSATVIVTMDENDKQSTPAGGQVPFVVISSRAKGAGAVTTYGNLFGTLRSIDEVFGLPLLGGAQNLSNGDIARYFG